MCGRRGAAAYSDVAAIPAPVVVVRLPLPLRAGSAFIKGGGGSKDRCGISQLIQSALAGPEKPNGPPLGGPFNNRACAVRGKATRLTLGPAADQVVSDGGFFLDSSSISCAALSRICLSSEAIVLSPDCHGTVV